MAISGYLFCFFTFIVGIIFGSFITIFYLKKKVKELSIDSIDESSLESVFNLYGKKPNQRKMGDLMGMFKEKFGNGSNVFSSYFNKSTSEKSKKEEKN